MPTRLHIDIETYSETDIKLGVYKYAEDPKFEILLFAYRYDDAPIKIIDLASGEKLPAHIINSLNNPEIKKHAFNAAFERVCLRRAGFDVPIKDWRCTSVKSSFCGLPLDLARSSTALGVPEDKAKLRTGKALIKYFCTPCKPTKVNGGRTRNLPHHAPEKWAEFVVYCINDVKAEYFVYDKLKPYKISDFERSLYCLDQIINDSGVLLDLDFAKVALDIYAKHKETCIEELKAITGLGNPNSVPQLKKWLEQALKVSIPSLAKKHLDALYESASDTTVRRVIKLRGDISKTSIQKYAKMLKSACNDSRGRGFIRFYGANRTGRWAGRIVQPQNLKRNYIQPIEDVRATIAEDDYDLALLLYDVADTLSQLIRTAFVAPEGMTLIPVDFSAIEARVVAWLAGEKWRLDVFNGDGKIYEASASKMFNVPIEEVTKENGLRARGKVAELALGYGGSKGAMAKMGAYDMGLNDVEIKRIVKLWRRSSPAIVNVWNDFNKCAMKAVARKCKVVSASGLVTFEADSEFLTIRLPSGRKLYYRKPSFTVNKWGHKALQYKGTDQDTGQWVDVQTYGGKLLENISQAISRDLLAESMLTVHYAGYKIVLHVHDELIVEVKQENSEKDLKRICEIMGLPIRWAKGLPLNADGYITRFYKKD